MEETSLTTGANAVAKVVDEDVVVNEDAIIKLVVLCFDNWCRCGCC